MRTSQEVSRRELPVRITKDINGTSEISLYSGPLEPNVVLQSMNRLASAFPKMKDNVDFFNLLSERVVANGFSNERLKDAINHILDNFQYKELVISDIIKFDRKVKLYTYSEVVSMVTKGLATWPDFEIREINGNHFRVKKADLYQ